MRMSAVPGAVSDIRHFEWMNPPYDQTAVYLNYIHERLRIDSQYREWCDISSMQTRLSVVEID